jgi:hypothetical protein
MTFKLRGHNYRWRRGKNVLYTGNRTVKPKKNHGELNCDAEFHVFVEIPNDSGILLVRSIRKRKR